MTSLALSSREDAHLSSKATACAATCAVPTAATRLPPEPGAAKAGRPAAKSAALPLPARSLAALFLACAVALTLAFCLSATTAPAAYAADAPAQGWVKQGGDWQYRVNAKPLHDQWKRIDGTWYYFKSNADMACGWQLVGDDWYHFANDGAMQTGWLKKGGRWYYLTSSGAMKTGWLKDGGVWYYLKESGKMATGWVQVGDDWYHCAGDGAMQTGWLKKGGRWYFLTPSGAMKTGWLKNGGWWYYLKESGAMQVGWAEIDGEQHRFNDHGQYMPTLGLNKLKKAVGSVPNQWYVTVQGAPLSTKTIDKLNNDMLRFWNHGHDVGFVLVDTSTGATISGNPYRNFQAASTIKGPYCCAVTYSYPNKAWKNRKPISDAVIWSINEQYQAVRNTFGGSPMKTYMKQAGVNHFSPNSVWVSRMRPVDLAKLWVRNYEFFGEREKGASWLQEYFLRSNYTFLRENLASRHPVFSKPGWIGGVSHNDAGIIMADDHPYVVAIMSSCDPYACHCLGKLARDLDSAHSEMIRNL